MIRLISSADAGRRSVAALGLDPERHSISDLGALATLIRRAASFSAPCSVRTLRTQIVNSLTGLVREELLVQQVEQSIEALVAYGDLIELPAREGEGSGIVLYLAQPSFVSRTSGTAFLIGVPPDGRKALPDSWDRRVHLRGHTRHLTPMPGEDLSAILAGFGLFELSEKLWLRRPAAVAPEALVAQFDRALSTSGTAGTANDLEVIDPDKPVRYYPGRWVKPGRLSGRFVGRREQLFGAPLWCYVELSRGQLTALYDIPATEWRACDHGWRLQLAIDYLHHKPQSYRTTVVSDKAAVRLSFFSPLPQWFRARLDIIGEPVTTKDALFAYLLPQAEYATERKLLADHAWLQEILDAH